jgi:hypothetical protein
MFMVFRSLDSGPFAKTFGNSLRHLEYIELREEVKAPAGRSSTCEREPHMLISRRPADFILKPFDCCLLQVLRVSTA